MSALVYAGLSEACNFRKVAPVLPGALCRKRAVSVRYGSHNTRFQDIALVGIHVVLPIGVTSR